MINKDNIIKEEFPNISYLIKTLETRENNEEMRHERSSRSGSYDFTRTSSYEEAVKKLYDGDKEIADRIEKKITTLDLSDYMPRRRVQTGPVGYVPHVPNAILGLPNSMIKMESEAMKNKSIMITTSVCNNSSTSAGDLEKCGVALLGVINALELSGHRVKVRVSFFDCENAYNNKYTMATVVVKDYGEQLDLRKLSFPVAHPSMFRRIGFKWLETVPGLERGSGFSSGYGHHCSVYTYRNAGLLEKNEIYIDYDTIYENNFDVARILENEFNEGKKS